MTVEIALRSFGQSAWLVGETGAEVDESGATPVLTGSYRFVLKGLTGDHVSEPLPFGNGGPRASVKGSDGDWTLVELAGAEFVYGAMQTMAASPKCPSLAFSRVGLVQYKLDAVPDFPALIELTDMSLSLRPGQPASANMIQYPSAIGWKELSLRRARHPISGGLIGYFVRRDETGRLAVFALAPGVQLDLDHTRGMRIFANQNAQIAFALETETGDTDGCIRFEGQGPRSLRVGLETSTRLAFENADSTSSSGTTWKTLKTVEARGGRFNRARFEDRHVRVKMTEEADTGGLAATPAGSTTLFGRSEWFDLDLEIPEDSNFDPAWHRAALVYRTGEIGRLQSAEADPWSRFYGVSIAGLSSIKNRQEIFDTDLAELRMISRAGEAPCVMSVGGEIDELGLSQVTPKPDASGATEVSISTDGMRIALSRQATGKACLEYRSETGELKFVDPKLEVPPAGGAARDPEERERAGARFQAEETGEKYSKSEFKLPEVDGLPGVVSLKLLNQKVEPIGKWVEPFRTVSKKLEMIELGGLKFEVKGPSNGIPGNPDDTGSIFDVDFEWPDDWKKVAVFSIASLGIGWTTLPKGISSTIDQFRDAAKDFVDLSKVQVNFDFLEMKANSPDDLAKFVRSRASDSLQVGYFAETRGDSGDMRMRQFIDDNVVARLGDWDGPVTPPDAKYDKIKKFYIPLDAGLSVVLVDHGADVSNSGPIRYTSDIIFDAAAENPGARDVRPSMLFKLSQKGVKKGAGDETRIPTDYSLLGYSDQEWFDLAYNSPALWPRASKVKGGRPDPTDPRWIGIFFRDLPVQFVAPPKVEAALKEKSKLLKAIYETLNKNMMLDYGWIGPKGTAWTVRLLDPDGYDVTPEKWEDHVVVRLEDISLQGTEGKPVAGEATLSLALQKIKGKTGAPLTVKGKFEVNAQKSPPVSAFELSISNEDGLVETSAIPGFDKAQIIGLSSDLKTMTLKLKLEPSEGLAAALPIFEADKAVVASLLLNFSGEPGTDFQLSLPTDSETNLFGRFPLTIQGVYLQVGDDGNKLLIRGRLGLGLVGLDAVGADIVLTEKDGDWDFDIYINEIGVSLEVGDNFKMKGLLSWASDDVPLDALRPSPINPKRYNEPVKSSDMSALGSSRNFWGILMLETNGFMGDLTILMKVGSQGEKTYWVAAVESDVEIGLGSSASFKDPAIVLAKNADMGAGLRKLLLNPYANNVAGLRPTPGGLDEKRDWLKSWKASKDIGSVVAGSGYLHLADGVAESPKSEDDGGNKYLTALVITDSGLFRLDAQTKLLGSKVIGFGIAVDTVGRRLLATVRLPEIKVPESGPPKYMISPGTMSLGISYGGAPYFLLSIGWPPLIEGSSLERDWSQATRVYIADLFPINTFWGGYRFVLDASAGFVRFGIAIRAGWTWAAELNGADIAKASAELGVTLGGVLEFELLWKEPQQIAPAPAIPTTGSRTLAIRTEASFDRIDPDLAAHIMDSLEIMERATTLGVRDVRMEATVYGDVWGKGSLEFLGVTLASIEIALRLRVQFCGTLKRGVTRAWGRGEIELTVTILCVKFKGRAGFDLWLKRGPYPCLSPLSSNLAAPQPEATMIDHLPLELDQ
ncbi:MAG: hypothetical protein RIA09_14440 [Hoeflea sp.]|uniref:hypothetical protein n=1 Tax=Hoeflea sp. TaxID=1940281 RepID=UPI0032EC7767